MILYEYPFNERVRTYVRLECLFGRRQHLLHRDDALDHHFALATLFDISDAANRADLKSDILKDLERQKQQLAAFRGNPAISEASLEVVLQQLEQAYAALVNQRSKAGETLAKDDWLASVRSRMAIPGGTCAFDMPTYHAWQSAPAAHRHADLERWTAPWVPLAQAVDILLQLLRGNARNQIVVASAGQFQMNLPHERDVQLLRVNMDQTPDLIPEISGNRFMLSIRLMRQGDGGEFRAARADAAMELALCL